MQLISGTAVAEKVLEECRRDIAELAADFRADDGTPFEDSLIAATAKVHGLTVATRNTGHFTSCGIEVVNPWEFGT